MAAKSKGKTTTRQKGIDTILKNIEKAMGHANDPIITKAPTVESFEKIPYISFGYKEVDDASGCGGAPKGKMIEIYGPESGGKSYLTLKIISEAQKMGEKCILVDAESSYNPIWAKSHGVDVDDLYIIDKPLSAEDTLDYVKELCDSGGFGLVVVDSTAALVPAKELEGSVSDQDYALLARAMSKACRKIVQACASTKCTCIFINQIREKMNVMFGSPETTPGGRALKFYSSMRIKVSPGSKIKVEEGGEERVIARKSYVQFVKNRMGMPFGECQIEIVFDEAARHPVVKLCKEAKTKKLVSIYKGEYKLHKDLVEGAKANVPTGTKSFPELADYVIKNSLLIPLLDAYFEAVEDDVTMEDGDVDKDIEALRDDPSTATSPMDGATVEVIQEEAPEIQEEEIKEEEVELD